METVDHLVEQLEAVDGLHHVVDRDVLTRDGAGLIDVAGLLLIESAALDTVGVVRHEHLVEVVQAALHARSALIAQSPREAAGVDGVLVSHRGSFLSLILCRSPQRLLSCPGSPAGVDLR